VKELGKFFPNSQIESIVNLNGRPLSCPSCGLYKYVLSPRMEPFGKFRKKILNVGEAPGETEDRKGKQWQGKAGRALRRMYRQLGIDLFEDCLNINAVNCRPMTKRGTNRSPTSHEIGCCRKRVLDIIEQYEPHVIICLGNPAIECLIGHRWKRNLGGVTKWRGRIIPDRDFQAWICPTFHPSYVERMDSQDIDTIWRRDLERALSMQAVPFPRFPNEENQVEIIDSPELLEPFPELVAFDYETTGLKPYAQGHRIVCASIAYHENYAVSFMMPTVPSERERFIHLLRAKDIGKIAHNMKFEESWSKIRLRQPVENWQWDSMLAAHVLDNRSGITGLKFQTYVNFGVVDYDSEINPYLKAKDEKNGNSLNRVNELIESTNGRKKLLAYCGLDSLFEYKLAMKQMKEIGVKI